MNRNRVCAARAAVVLAGAALAGCATVGEPVAEAPAHHRERGFANPAGQYGVDPFEFVVDRVRLGLAGPEASAAPVLAPGEAAARWAETGADDAVQWLGHAGVRLRLGGVVVLTDPVFAERVTPVPPLGPLRASPPPLPVAEIVEVDAILISHDHYDHFEPASVARIAGASGVRCLLPLGVAEEHRLGCAVTSLDWGEAVALGPLRATLLPALHESGRGIFDRNRSLWGSWLLEAGGRRVYFHGDGGYGPQFAEAGAGAGAGGCGVDLAIISVGGYEPRQFNREIHMTPEEAIRAIRDLCAARALIVHWGTYPMGLETGAETVRRLRDAARAAGLAEGTLLFLPIGDVVRF